ncbi:hypothetical protein [Roseomonas elaeocarpi]|uniref:DUF3108 domain-containing protein n=1 Tax=Roseomonas elaeocarpi TaxID=907779 RepID=A0ABV6K2D9_9PROT
MAEQIHSADMSMVATTTGGTGAAQLGATPATYLHPGTQIATGWLVTWREVNADGSQWQIFRGRYVAGSPNTITRETLLLRWDNGNAFINWPDGQTRYIFPDVFARDAVLLDSEGRLPDGLVRTPLQPVSGNYSGNYPLTATTVFIYSPIPAGTRFLWLNGYVRGYPQAGALDLLASAVLRNVGDTATDVDFSTVGALSVAAGSSVSMPITMAWDLGAPLAEGRSMRLSAATSNGQTFNLQEVRVSIACGRQ